MRINKGIRKLSTLMHNLHLHVNLNAFCIILYKNNFNVTLIDIRSQNNFIVMHQIVWQEGLECIVDLPDEICNKINRVTMEYTHW